MESSVKAVVVDANIWIALIDKQDSLHDQAYEILQEIDEETQILLTDYVVQEVITVLLYKKRSQLIQGFLKYFRSNPHIISISIDTDFFDSITKYIEKQNYSPKLALTDWSLLFLADYFEIHVLTFDKQLANACKKLTGQ